jgi:hypothetical protein
MPPRFTTSQFLDTFSGADKAFGWEDIAEAAASVTDDPDLVLVATDFLQALEEFKEILTDVGFEL